MKDTTTPGVCPAPAGTIFARCSACRLCELWQTCGTVCIPTVKHHPPSGQGGSGTHTTALLIVGEAPGATEDQAGEPFVGKSGQILRVGYVNRLKLWDYADVFLTNAVRCRPPENDTPSKKCIRACSAYLSDDILALKARYERVVLLAVGGVAAISLGRKTLTTAMANQGSEYLGCPVFATFHPAYLLRNPSMSASVDTHLHLLRDSLAGKETSLLPAPKDIDLNPEPVDYPIQVLSLDIETYGILRRRRRQQTQFHPSKSQRHDRVPRHDQLVTVGLSWRGPDGQLRHGLFRMDDAAGRRSCIRFLRAAVSNPDFGFVLGQNIVFDLLYLRACIPALAKLLDHPVRVMDLMIVNYLHNELRPERSLKALAPLLQVTKYEQGGFKQYDSSEDRALWEYNCQDTMATLLCFERLAKMIDERYGDNTRKLREFSLRWYSDLIWLAVWMSEAGVALDEPYLRRLDGIMQARLGHLQRIAEQDFGLVLRGAGSEKSKRAVMDAAHERMMNLLPPGKASPDLETTKKTKKVSFCIENRNALLNHLPAREQVARSLRLMGRYQDVSGLLDRYLTPMLRGRKKDNSDKSTCIIDGIVYPRWFLVPSEFDDGSRGGTKQARIVCKSPPIQTFPPIIKKAIRCRYRRGHLIWFDYSQIELRVAALLSGDEVMSREYAGKPDLHGKTAELIFGAEIRNHPKFKVLYRQAGKVLNFLMLYRGGARKFRESLLRDLGINYPLHKCDEVIRRFWQRHKGLAEWQAQLLDFVMKHGYYELPLTGQSRLFLGGKQAKEQQINEIVNLPVQAVAANIMVAAQFEMFRRFRAERRSDEYPLVPLNIYDASPIEVPYGQLTYAVRVMNEVLPNPPYYEQLCHELGRRLPMVAEYKVDGGPTSEIGSPTVCLAA